MTIPPSTAAMGRTTTTATAALADGSASTPDISVIVAVVERADDLTELYEAHADALRAAGYSFEFLFVVNAGWDAAAALAEGLAAEHAHVRAFRFRRNFGEAASLAYGVRHARGGVICTLPAYFQVEAAELVRLVQEVEAGCDMATARRWPRTDPTLNQWQTRLFAWLVARGVHTTFRDVSCGVRAMRRAVALQLPLYGELHRFIPVFAERDGFWVKEVDVQQSPRDTAVRIYSLKTYLQRFLDLLSLVFLVRFTHKPLRFFGAVGGAFFGGGLLVNLYLTYERLWLNQPLATRPLLVLGTLLIVLGVQVISVGLIGEIVVYVNARPSADVANLPEH